MTLTILIRSLGQFNSILACLTSTAKKQAVILSIITHHAEVRRQYRISIKMRMKTIPADCVKSLYLKSLRHLNIPSDKRENGNDDENYGVHEEDSNFPPFT